MLLSYLFSGVHVTLESLLWDKEIKTTTRELVHCSGRSCPSVGETEAMIGEKQPTAVIHEKSPSAVQLNGASEKETVAV